MFNAQRTREIIISQTEHRTIFTRLICKMWFFYFSFQIKRFVFKFLEQKITRDEIRTTCTLYYVNEDLRGSLLAAERITD